MLDSFEILSSSGVVLWSKTYVPVKSNIVNNLIADVFIEERIAGIKTTEDGSAARNPAFKRDQYTLKWTVAKDLGLVFVVSYCALNSVRASANV
jgi:signal recognition particle receptor subunit alpha